MTPTRTFRIARHSSREGLVLAALLLAPLLTLGIMLAQFEDRAWEKLRSRRELHVLLLVLPMAAAAGWWAQRQFVAHARLTVDERGIALDSGLPAWMGANHRIGWSEVQKVAVMEPLAMVQVRKAGLARPLAIRMLMWVPADRPDTPMPKGGFFKRPDIRATPVWKTLEARGLFAPGREDARQDLVNFDLAKHPATRTALSAMAALAAYWAIDCFAAREAWAEWKPSYLLGPAVLGVAGALIAFMAMRASRARPAAPPQVIGALALFVGACVALASWPGLIRVNQVVGGPLEPHAYVRNASCDTLEPVEQGLPPIEYTGQAKAYWCSMPRDRQVTVPVRKGLGGLYQVDLTEHTRAIRQFRAQGGR